MGNVEVAYNYLSRKSQWNIWSSLSRSCEKLIIVLLAINAKSPLPFLLMFLNSSLLHNRF